MKNLLMYADTHPHHRTLRNTIKLHSKLRRHGMGITNILAEHALKLGSDKLNANLSDEAIKGLASASPGILNGLFKIGRSAFDKGRELITGNKRELQVPSVVQQPAVLASNITTGGAGIRSLPEKELSHLPIDVLRKHAIRLSHDSHRRHPKNRVMMKVVKANSNKLDNIMKTLAREMVEKHRKVLF